MYKRETICLEGEQPMKFALTHLWSSLKGLAKDSPLLLILIILFSCTPFYINTDWFAQIDTIFYIMYSVIIILQSYITRERRYSLLFTIVSIIIAAGLHTIYKTYQDIPGIKMAIENMTALWLYSMITLYFTSADGHYIGEIINRLKRIGITIVSSLLYNIIIAMSLWFLYIILGDVFPFKETTFKILVSINLFICTTMICSYRESPKGPPEPGSFFTVVFGVIIPKASIITGILANIYLVLILLGLRDDTRFLYTYYPYVSLFYLFYLTSFRSTERSKTQQLLCFFFITLTLLCLCLIGKRVINEPVLWLNTIYVAAFNLIFLAYNLYSLVKRLTPSVHTSIMALALGAVLLMPAIGYTSYMEFTTYDYDGESWQPHLDIARTFSPDYSAYKIQKDDEMKTKQEESENTIKLQTINFKAIEQPEVVSIGDYNNFISHIELKLYEPTTRTAETATVDFSTIKFNLVNDGKDLEVFLPNGIMETHHIYDTLLTVDKNSTKPVVIEGTDYRLYIYSYFFNEYGTRSITFSVLYK